MDASTPDAPTQCPLCGYSITPEADRLGATGMHRKTDGGDMCAGFVVAAPVSSKRAIADKIIRAAQASGHQVTVLRTADDLRALGPRPQPQQNPIMFFDETYRKGGAR